MRKLNNIVKINTKDYPLVISTGFYRKTKTTIETFEETIKDAEKMAECLKWALFYGSRKSEDWKSTDDMNITDDDIDDIIGGAQLLNDALILSLPKEKQDEILSLEEKMKNMKSEAVDNAAGEQSPKN